MCLDDLMMQMVCRMIIAGEGVDEMKDVMEDGK